MPDWCSNIATISHEDSSKIDLIEHECNSPDSQLFSKLFPNKESDTWDYDWCIENWGTKWEGSIISYERNSPNSISIEMDTAWSPPISFYDYIMENHNYNVLAFYYEPNIGFTGWYQNGDDESFELTPENWNIIPKEIVNEFYLTEEDFNKNNQDF